MKRVVVQQRPMCVCSSNHSAPSHSTLYPNSPRPAVSHVRESRTKKTRNILIPVKRARASPRRSFKFTLKRSYAEVVSRRSAIRIPRRSSHLIIVRPHDFTHLIRDEHFTIHSSPNANARPSSLHRVRASSVPSVRPPEIRRARSLCQLVFRPIHTHAPVRGVYRERICLRRRGHTDRSASSRRTLVSSSLARRALARIFGRRQRPPR